MLEASPAPVPSFTVPLNVTLSFVTEAEELIFTAGAFLSTTIVPALICLLFPTPALSVAFA